jgi:tRNA-dihydrouridine synthase C
MVSNPGLALSIVSPGHTVPWNEILPLMQAFWELVCSRLEARQCGGRLKQWLNYLRRHYPEAQAAYAELRTVNDPREIARWLREALAVSNYRVPELA